MADEPFPFPVRWTLTEAVVWIMTRNQDAVDWSRHALWSPLPTSHHIAADLSDMGLAAFAGLSHAMECLRLYLVDGGGFPVIHDESGMPLAGVEASQFAGTTIAGNLGYGLRLDSDAYRDRQILVDREPIRCYWPARGAGHPTADDLDDVLAANALTSGLDPLLPWPAALAVARSRHAPGKTDDPANQAAKRINRKLAEKRTAGEHLAAVADTARELITSGIGADYALLCAAKQHPAIGRGGDKLVPDADLAALAKQWLSHNSG